MKQWKLAMSDRTQRGFTLVELMIAMVIGLVLVAGIANIFSANKKAYRYNDALSGMFDNGGFALDFISGVLSDTGYVPDIDNFPDMDADNNGKTDKADVELWAYGANMPLSGTEGNGLTSDSLTINTMADPIMINDAGNPPIDCVGTVVTAATAPFNPNVAVIASYGISNQILVKNSPVSGRPALFCNNIELVDGIERLEILYGVDTDVPSDGAPDRYLPFDAIANPLQVLTVRIAILVASAEETRSAPDTATYNLLGTIVPAAKDKRQRRVMTSTIKLRNRCARAAGLDLCV